MYFSAGLLQQLHNNVSLMNGAAVPCVQIKHQSTVAQQSKSGS